MNTQDGRPKDTTGKERIEEGLQAFHLQQSPSATDGSDVGKEGTSTLTVLLEGSDKARTLCLQANTTEEVRQGIFRKIPSLWNEKIGIRFTRNPKESSPRLFFEGPVSHLSQLYAVIYLCRH